MKLFDIFFSFEGRLSHSGFFRLLSFAGLLTVGLTALGIALLSSGVAIAIPYGILLIGLASLAGMWSGAALLTRRLHDLNLTAGHAAFVYGLNLFSICFAAWKPSIGVAMTVFTVGASIWFLLTPGTAGRNRFGEATRARRAFRAEISPGLAESLHAG